MKASMMVIAVVFLLVCMAGCSGVILSPTYSQMLDDSAYLSETLADRYEAGKLDPNTLGAGLRWNANAWKKFQDARDGRASE